MPMKMGHSREVVSQNIKEMVKAGHPVKSAIAASLAHARKSKKMSEGGMVEEADPEMGMGSVDSAHDEGKAGEPVYPEGMDDEGLSPNVEDQEDLVSALQSSKYKANENSHSYEADDSVAGQKMSRGGVVQEEMGDTMVGNKPELDWINDGTGEPMSSMPMKPADVAHAPVEGVPGSPGLSKEAIEAIRKKRAMRMYGKYDPK